MSIFSEIPIVGRLRLRDYIRLCLAFLILVFEPLLRTVSRLLPLRRLQTFLTPTSKPLIQDEAESLQNIGERERLAKTESLLHGLKNTEDFADFWGFACETHYVTTADGYILGLHRIPRAPNDSDNGQKRPVALLWHGFLMCSEVWVCTPDPKLSLAFTLARAGYDVWLGNSRGNKYSQKHRKLKPLDTPFWDFCFEDFAMYDLPNSVDYILRVTDQSSLSYIGFSQGTAQGFAALSLSAELNQKINLFIALAPVTKPIGLENQGFNSLVKTSPDLIYLLFGRSCLLPSTIYWQNNIKGSEWVKLIDYAILFIFTWQSKYILSKEIVYKHLYSYSSVKSVVHWFQIISSERFQMYDDSPTFLPNAEGAVVPKFPTLSITTPTAIFYGKKDTLPDVEYILDNTLHPVLCMEVEEYEHLHFLWAKGLDKVVYPAILGLLSEFNEIWSDAQVEFNESAETFKTVPWISQAAIKASRLPSSKTDFIIRRSILSDLKN